VNVVRFSRFVDFLTIVIVTGHGDFVKNVS
jgi:hypothetical protein